MIVRRRKSKGVSTLDSVIYAVIMAMGIIGVMAIYQVTMHKQEQRHAADRELWHKERQMLLDRIQAPSFAEYTAKVIKEKKAEQPEEPREPVEFVS